MTELDSLRQKFLELEFMLKEARGEPSKGLVISDTDRQKLESLVGRNFSTVEDLVRNVERALTLTVGITPIALSPQLIDRLKSRAFSMDFDKFVTMIVVRALETYVGLR